MFASSRAEWRRLKQGAPGRRFVEAFESHQGAGKRKWRRALWVAVGTVVVLVSPLASLIPGPGGILVFALGLVLLSRELRFVARALDRLEPKISRGWRTAKRGWERSSTAVRIALSLLGLSLLGAMILLGVRAFT
jgi:putative transmembrane protein PGPGW